MAVYTISRPMAKKRVKGEKKPPLRSHMVTMFTSFGADVKNACDYFDAQFENTDDYKAGWRLVGLHAISEFHQGHVKKWSEHFDPVPPAMTAVIKDQPMHLRLVHSND